MSLALVASCFFPRAGPPRPRSALPLGTVVLESSDSPTPRSSPQHARRTPGPAGASRTSLCRESVATSLCSGAEHTSRGRETQPSRGLLIPTTHVIRRSVLVI